MSTRTVTYTITRPVTGVPWPNARLSWQLIPGSFDGESSYPNFRADSTTDENGEGSIELWANEEGSVESVYRVSLPSGETADFTLPAGDDPIDLTVLRALGVINADWTAELLSTAIIENPDLQGPPGTGGVPDGGTTGQVLTKLSDDDGDADWQDSAGGGGAGEDFQVYGIVAGTAGMFDPAELELITEEDAAAIFVAIDQLRDDLEADVAGHIADTPGAHAATAISNAPAGNIAATTVQAAIDELDAEKSATGHTHTLSAITDAGTAAALNVPAAGDATSGQVVKGSDTRLTDARTPSAHSHAASAITNTPAGTIAATDVQAAINELDTDSRMSDSRAPTGAAGGALSGTFPSPDLAAAVAGNGLAISGNVLSVGVDGSTVELSSDAIRVKALGITDAHVATANKDGADATASMRTLGTGAAQAAKGNHSHAGSAITALPVEIGIACSDETTALTTGLKATFRMPFAMTLTAFRTAVTTAPTGATLIVDLKEAGTTVLSTKPAIDISEKTSVTGTAAVVSDAALADDAEMTVHCDQVGSTVAGAGLKVWLIGTRA